MRIVTKKGLSRLKKDLSFREFIKELKKADCNKNSPIHQTMQELASTIGMEQKKLKQIYYKTRPTHNRDYVIAICGGLGLNADETNYAIRYYDNNFSLLSDDNNDGDTRDKVIIELLNDAEDNEDALSINEFNEALQVRGFGCLDITESKK